MIIFTSICTNYAHKARTLAESVKKNIPDAKFLVCLTEREVPKSMECPYFDELIVLFQYTTSGKGERVFLLYYRDFF